MKLFDLSSTQGRIITGVLVLVLGLLLGWMLRGALLSPSNMATMTSVKDWRVSCPPRTDKKASCEATQSVFEAQSRMNLLTLIVANDPDLKKRMLVITVPYDTFLPEGLGLQFNEETPKVYRYEACNGAGCFAKVELDDKLLAAFQKKGVKARVLVARLDRKVLPIDFSLAGFNEAMSNFNASEAKRKSWFWRLWS
jgi:invasion protein IalB